MDSAGQDAGQYERKTVAEAAAALGISKEAVRKRIARGTLRSDKGEDGTVWVYPPPSGTASGTGVGDRDLLYQEQRERIAYLERQVEEEREARRRADTLLARLMDRVPELETPTDSPPAAREAAEPGETGAVRGNVPTGPEAAPEQRPWWRRLFGG